MKIKFSSLIAMLLWMYFTSCSKGDDKIWDFAPIDIGITVSDKNGNDLLNPNKESSICKNGIKAIYKGEEYELNFKSSRYYMPTFYGLRLVKNTEGRYMLLFGEFDRAKNHEALEVSIDWNDGSAKDDIILKHSFEMVKKRPVFRTLIFLNGEYIGEKSILGIVK